MHTTAILCLLKYRDAKSKIVVSIMDMLFVIMLIYTVSRLNMFITKKHVQISITLILLMLFILCATLLTTFAIISNGIRRSIAIRTSASLLSLFVRFS